MKYLTIAILAFSLNAFAQVPTNGFVVYSTGSAAGDALLVSPSALPDNICSGLSVQLNALPSGGSGNYTYSWTSDPQGFTSDQPDPMVTPLVTTEYTVVINDGSSITSGNVAVIVRPSPVVNLIPINDATIHIINQQEISVCAFNSYTLDAGNPGAIYLWSNNSQEQTITVETSGITTDLQEFEVTVTDPVTNCSTISSMSVLFTFTDCIYGVDENNQGNLHIIYPNPSLDGYFNFNLEGLKGEITLEVFTSQGTMIRRDVILNYQDNLLKSSLDLSDQTPGVYFLKVTGNQMVIQQKLIIQ